jgi:hypothetical protein
LLALQTPLVPRTLFLLVFVIWMFILVWIWRCSMFMFHEWRVRFYLEWSGKNEGFPIFCLSLTRMLALVKMGLGVVVVMVDLHLKQVPNWPMTKMWVKMLRKVYELKQRDGSSINSSNCNKIKKIGLLIAKWQLCGFFSNSMIKSAFVNCFKFQWMRCILCHCIQQVDKVGQNFTQHKKKVDYV